MTEVNPPIKALNQSDELMSWHIVEYEKQEHGRLWYIIAAIIGLAGLIYAFWASNFLFVVIIVLAAVILIINDSREPDKVKFSITDEGLYLGRRFIDYSELKNFSIIYKPRQDIKKLYFEFNNAIRPRLSIYLDNNNPLKIRDILLNYLQEDLERENEPLSEGLAKLFRI